MIRPPTAWPVNLLTARGREREREGERGREREREGGNPGGLNT